MTKVIKIPPLKCPKCESPYVYKNKKEMMCNDCSTIFKNGKQIPKDREYLSKGYDPKIDLGDYIEGTIGVHEY